MDDQSIKDVLNSLWSEGERDSASVAVQMEMVAARRRSSTMRRGSGLSADKTAGTGINAALTCFFPADDLPHRPVRPHHSEQLPPVSVGQQQGTSEHTEQPS